MKIRELIQELQKLDPELEIRWDVYRSSGHGSDGFHPAMRFSGSVADVIEEKTHLAVIAIGTSRDKYVPPLGAVKADK